MPTANATINAAKINGNDYVLMVDPSGTSDFLPILCGLNLSVTRQLSTIDAGSKCGDDIAPDKETASAQMTGFILDATITDVYGLADLHSLVTNKSVVPFKIAPKPGVDTINKPEYDFNGFISNIQDSYNKDSKADVSLTVTASDGVTFSNSAE